MSMLVILKPCLPVLGGLSQLMSPSLMLKVWLFKLFSTRVIEGGVLPKAYVTTRCWTPPKDFKSKLKDIGWFQMG